MCTNIHRKKHKEKHTINCQSQLRLLSNIGYVERSDRSIFFPLYAFVLERTDGKTQNYTWIYFPLVKLSQEY